MHYQCSRWWCMTMTTCQPVWHAVILNIVLLTRIWSLLQFHFRFFRFSILSLLCFCYFSLEEILRNECWEELSTMHTILHVIHSAKRKRCTQFKVSASLTEWAAHVGQNGAELWEQGEHTLPIIMFIVIRISHPFQWLPLCCIHSPFQLTQAAHLV